MKTIIFASESYTDYYEFSDSYTDAYRKALEESDEKLVSVTCWQDKVEMYLSDSEEENNILLARLDYASINSL